MSLCSLMDSLCSLMDLPFCQFSSCFGKFPPLVIALYNAAFCMCTLHRMEFYDLGQSMLTCICAVIHMNNKKLIEKKQNKKTTLFSDVLIIITVISTEQSFASKDEHSAFFTINKMYSVITP